MSLYQLKFLNSEQLAQALASVGADARSLPFFDNRREIKTLFVPNVDVRAANVIKQEILSRGGDAALSAKAVGASEPYTDIIIFASAKQFSFLADKLDMMPWWGLPAVVSGIRDALAGMAKKSRKVTLPCGAPLTFGERTNIMGIINLTDDSFFSASRTNGNIDSAVAKALRLAEEGADILDIGAESTRPGSSRVPEDDEIRRVTEAVRAIRKELPLMPLSIDTTRASVARAALGEGADIINDISGLTYEPEIAAISAEYNAMLVLMHMRGTPETMRDMCDYDNILLDMTDFFDKSIAKAESMGAKRSQIILDPGIGVAKNHNKNLYLLRNMEAFATFGLPVLIGVSRKGTIGFATDSPSAEDRLEGTVAVSVLCSWHDIDIVRVHDVKENKKAVMMAESVKGSKYE